MAMATQHVYYRNVKFSLLWDRAARKSYLRIGARSAFTDRGNNRPLGIKASQGRRPLRVPKRQWPACCQAHHQGVHQATASAESNKARMTIMPMILNDNDINDSTMLATIMIMTMITITITIMIMILMLLMTMMLLIINGDNDYDNDNENGSDNAADDDNDNETYMHQHPEQRHSLVSNCMMSIHVIRKTGIRNACF